MTKTYEVDPTLKAEYDKLSQRAKQLQEELDAQTKAIQEGPDYKDLTVRLDAASIERTGYTHAEEYGDVWGKRDISQSVDGRMKVRESELYSIFTDDERLAYYGRWGGSTRIKTNIHQEVFSAIRSKVAISKLLGSEIEDMVRGFQARALSEDATYSSLADRERELTTLENELEQQRTKLFASLQPKREEMYIVAERVRELSGPVLHPQKVAAKQVLKEVREFALSTETKNAIYQSVVQEYTEAKQSQEEKTTPVEAT